jgi:hypothetical protein
LWLDGDRTRLEYKVPSQSAEAMGQATWTTTISVDPREIGRRRLLSFPDGSWVDLDAGSAILGGVTGSEVSFDLPAQLQPRSRAWTHLAFVSTPASTDLYVQGLKLGRQVGAYLRPRLDATTDAAAFTTAGLYPDASHEEISTRLTAGSHPSWERYLCERERGSEAGCLDSIHRPGGSESSCVRAAILFPEGPLTHDRPRPDSRSNTFCRSCHSKEHPTPALRIAGPLKAGPAGTELATDDRRQPAQAPRSLHGFLPRGFLGLDENMEAPPEGVLLDRWLYPAAGGDSSGRPAN